MLCLVVFFVYLVMVLGVWCVEWMFSFYVMLWMLSLLVVFFSCLWLDFDLIRILISGLDICYCCDVLLCLCVFE